MLRVLNGDDRALSTFGLPDTVYLHVCVCADVLCGGVSLTPNLCWSVQIVDTDPQQRALAYTDVSKVKKYEMSDEDYGKRKGAVAAPHHSMKRGQKSKSEVFACSSHRH